MCYIVVQGMHPISGLGFTHFTLVTICREAFFFFKSVSDTGAVPESVGTIATWVPVSLFLNYLWFTEKTTENSQILKYSTGDHSQISLISGSCCLSVFNLFKDYSLISHGHRFQNPAMERPIDSLCCFTTLPWANLSTSVCGKTAVWLCERPHTSL